MYLKNIHPILQYINSVSTNNQVSLLYQILLILYFFKHSSPAITVLYVIYTTRDKKKNADEKSFLFKAKST